MLKLYYSLNEENNNLFHFLRLPSLDQLQGKDCLSLIIVTIVLL